MARETDGRRENTGLVDYTQRTSTATTSSTSRASAQRRDGVRSVAADAGTAKPGAIDPRSPNQEAGGVVSVEEECVLLDSDLVKRRALSRAVSGSGSGSIGRARDVAAGSPRRGSNRSR